MLTRDDPPPSGIAGATGVDRWLCVMLVLAFSSLYTWSAVRLYSAGLGERRDVVFDADLSRVIANAAAPQPPLRRASVHPLYVLFINPIGSPLAAGISAWTGLPRSGDGTTAERLAASAVSTAFASACVAFMYLTLRRLQLDRPVSLAATCLLGFSASQWWWGSVPETHILGSLIIVINFWLLARGAQSQWPYVVTGLFGFGATVTNLAYSVVAAVVAEAAPMLLRWTALRRSLRRSVLLVLAVAVLAAPLLLLQNMIYGRPVIYRSTWIARLASEREFAGNLTEASPLRRVSAAAAHHLVYGVVAPSLGLMARRADGAERVGGVLAFSPDVRAGYGVLDGLAALGVVVTMIGGATMTLVGRDRDPARYRVAIVAAAIIAGNIALFSAYGAITAQFLFTPLSTPAVLVLIALAGGRCRSHMARAAVVCWLVALCMAAGWASTRSFDQAIHASTHRAL